MSETLHNINLGKKNNVFVSEHETIFTDRLCLRAWNKNDASGLVDLLHNDENLKSLTMMPVHWSLEKVHEWIDNIFVCQKERTLYSWVFSLKDNVDLMVGCVSVIGFSSGNNSAEIAYFTSIDKRNLGLTSEAVNAVNKFCFDKLKINRLYLTCDPLNTGSIKVAENTGFLFEGLMRDFMVNYEGHYKDRLLYAQLAKDC